MSILLLTSVSSEEEAMWLSKLRSALPEEDVVLMSELSDKAEVDMAIVANPPQGVLHTLSNLKWIQSLWAGVDALLVDPTLPEDVPLVRLIDPALSASMAEATATHVLALHRDLPRYARQQQRQEWRQHELLRSSERRIGILGLGEMGVASAQQLRALGFNVRGWSRSLKTLEGIECFAGQGGLRKFLNGLDVLVNLLPLTPETKGILAKDLFSQLPKGAGLINFGRGGHQVEGDVIAALDAGQLSHAVLDVFSQEPLSSDNPLWRHPHITLLPHVAAPTNSGTAVGIVANNIKNYRKTGQLPKQVERSVGY
ncbi:hydroxyacid dehydrogenase [Kiloniella spongiae]|uniref:Hydroxyacid dehydrogenase n=1 Tax=Kiloniella spongiae TaxID=1489064 RepID=A0A0H2MJG3_9PROT|nr:glyoxylate/hydroxypyruvate reductase A [Kiloniella spongiae]KLN62351.1 hydroxyacid dehydrogenase [Kiloniella spongiae]